MNPTSAAHQRSPWNPAAYAFSRAVLPEPAASETAELALLSAQWEGSDGDRTAVLAAVRTAVSERLASDHGPVEREDLERWLLAGEQAFLAESSSAAGQVPEVADQSAVDQGWEAAVAALELPASDEPAGLPEPAGSGSSGKAAATAPPARDVPEEWLVALGTAPAPTPGPEDLVSAAGPSDAAAAQPRQPVPEDWVRALAPTALTPDLPPRRPTRSARRLPGLFESAVDRSVGEWSRPRLRLALAAGVVAVVAIAGIGVIATTFDAAPEDEPVTSSEPVQPMPREQLRATPTVESAGPDERAARRQRTRARRRSERSGRERSRPADTQAAPPARPAPVSPPRASPPPVTPTPTPSPGRPPADAAPDPPPERNPAPTPPPGDPVLEDPQPTPPADEPRRQPPP